MNQIRPSLKPGSIFFPKLGEEPKKKVLTQIWTYFCPKLGEEQKKRSSLKFGPIFCPKLGEEQKKRSSLKIGPLISPKSGMNKGQGRKKIWRDNLNSSGTPEPGPPTPGYDVPPEPPSRRPCPQLMSKYLSVEYLLISKKLEQ